MKKNILKKEIILLIIIGGLSLSIFQSCEIEDFPIDRIIDNSTEKNIGEDDNFISKLKKLDNRILYEEGEFDNYIVLDLELENNKGWLRTSHEYEGNSLFLFFINEEEITLRTGYFENSKILIKEDKLVIVSDDGNLIFNVK